MKIELCGDSLEALKLASKYQLDRIELCSALSVGGINPALELTKKCLENAGDVEVHVMVRLREGDFVYTDAEIEVMCDSIQHYAELGVHGVVFGCLSKEGGIHLEHTERLNSKAKKYNVQSIFHRAFDFSTNAFESLNQLIDLEIDRILTSGKFTNQPNTFDNLKALINQANGRIEIMAGSGITVNNVTKYVSTGIDAVHFTSHTLMGNPEDGMGQKSVPNPFKLTELIKQIKSV